MAFSANPKPSVGQWTINGTKIPVAGADENNMYVSGAFVEKVRIHQLFQLVCDMKQNFDRRNQLCIQIVCDYFYFHCQDGLPGQWEVELTINKLSESDVAGQHKLEITNDEGSTEYLFELHKGTKPPPGN